MKDYRQKNPEVTVLDPPDAIEHLHNRQSMLQDVADLNLSDCHGNLLTSVLLNCKKYLFFCLFLPFFSLLSFYLFVFLNWCSYLVSDLVYFAHWLFTILLGKVGVPRQLVIVKDPSSIPYEVTKAGLKLPLGMLSLISSGHWGWGAIALGFCAYHWP